MTAIFYITIALMWLVMVSCTRHLLESAAVRANESQLHPEIHRRLRMVIILTILTIGTMLQFSMTYVYSLHLETLG